MKELIIFNTEMGKIKKDIKVVFKCSQEEDGGDLFCISPKDRTRIGEIGVMG